MKFVYKLGKNEDKIVWDKKKCMWGLDGFF